MNWPAIALRSLVAFGLFFVAALIGRTVSRWFPQGRLKRFLMQPMRVIPQNETERRSWWPVFWLLAPIAALIALILFAPNSPTH